MKTCFLNTGSMGLLNALFLALICSVDCRDEIIGQIYYKTELGLTQVPANIPSNVGQVHLDANSLTTIPRNVFSNLSQCTVLKLRNNNIRTIEEEAFNGLESLDTLDMYGNNLKVLHKGMFHGMSVLRVLNIAANGITTIPPRCFQSLSTLEELYLTSHSMTTISGDMWIGLLSVTHLDLQHSPSMQTVSPGSLSHLPKLDVFHLHNNALKTLPNDIFNDADFPNSNGHPPSLRMTLKGNPLVCDKRLCWIKQAEQDGWLRWGVYSGESYGPECTNNVNWNNLVLDCQDTTCPEFEEEICRAECEEKDQAVEEGAFDENNCLFCKCRANQHLPETETLKLALVAVGSVFVGISLTALLILVYLKRNGVKFCQTESDKEEISKVDSKEEKLENRASENHGYEYIDDPLSATAPLGNTESNAIPQYLDIVDECPHQYQTLRR